jgi:hypothetical protein
MREVTGEALPAGQARQASGMRRQPSPHTTITGTEGLYLDTTCAACPPCSRGTVQPMARQREEKCPAAWPALVQKSPIAGHSSTRRKKTEVLTLKPL